MVNLILQIEVLCPYKLHNGAFLNLNFWPVRQEHTYAVWTLHCLNREKFATGVKTMCRHNYGSSNFLFGIDLHFHPGGLWRRQLFLLFFYFLLKTFFFHIRKRGAMVEYQIVSLKDWGSRLGIAAYETFQLCRRSSTFLKVCQKSSIFIVKFSSGMPKTFFDTRLNWSCVTRCRCRTT
jgi:hypothetical protein